MSRRFAIVDNSMRPTIEPGDWVIAVRRRGATIRGEVVIFTHLSYPGLSLIKRVIGLPGERVTAMNGRVHIDDRVLEDPWGNGPTNTDSETSVPMGAVWVLGDNRRSSSVDSRVLNAIPLEDVRWRVVARYWPPSRAGRIDA